MAATTLTMPRRTRADTVLGRAAVAARRNAPGFGRWLARSARRARQVVLHVTGLASICAAAWMVAVPLGLLAAGVSLLALEYLSAPAGPQR